MRARAIFRGLHRTASGEETIMQLYSTCHNHTTLDDGKSTPAEMAQAALDAGFTDFGISGHSRIEAPGEAGWFIESEEQFLAVMDALKRQFAPRLRIWAGMEQDWYGPVHCREKLDYLIGSVHALRSGETGRYYWMDGAAASLAACRDEMFGGDMEKLVRAFYRLTAENVQRWHPDVIGHFDIVGKNNEGGAFFDEESPACRAAALEALHACCETGAVLEVNTGGMRRGYRTVPYPARFLLAEAHAMGARVTLNADAHAADAVTFRLAEAAELLRSVGYTEYASFENGAFVQRPL